MTRSILKICLVSVVLLLFQSLLIIPAYAATCVKTPNAESTAGDNWNLSIFKNDPACLSDPSQARGYIGDVISTVLTLMLIAGAIGSFAMLIFGAYQYIMSQNDPAKTKQGRQTITYAIVGLIVMSLVYVFILIYNNIVPN